MKKTDRQYVELDLGFIVSATENIRDTSPGLTKRGFTLFGATEEQPSLMSLALSEDSAEQGQFVTLIEENDPSIKELADNMVATGQLEPIRVRPAEAKGEFDLVFGARRVLGRLYIHAKSGGKIPARLTAEIAEHEGQDALYAAISENIRAEPSPIDEARSYERLRKCFEMKPTEIATAMGRSAKVVQTRLKLLRLPKDLQEKVHLGKIGVKAALKHLEGGNTHKEKTTRKMPSLVELKQLYGSAPEDLPEEVRPLITEDVRRLFAFWLGVEYAPRLEERAA